MAAPPRLHDTPKATPGCIGVANGTERNRVAHLGGQDRAMRIIRSSEAASSALMRLALAQPKHRLAI
jgi:hypothetical protein